METEYNEAVIKKMRRGELSNLIEELINDKKALGVKLENLQEELKRRDEQLAEMEQTYQEHLLLMEKAGKVKEEAAYFDQLKEEGEQIRESSRTVIEKTKQDVYDILESFKGRYLL